jgi:Protein of unknown function (DUF3999)
MKTHFYKLLVLLICSSFSFNTFADSNSVPVFEINSGETYIQAPLEKEIYYFSRKPYLSDLQVRDAQGNKVPFRIVSADTESQNIRREIPAVFFPIAPDTSEDSLRKLGSTRIQITADNMKVDIESNQAAEPANIQNPDFYLIHLKGLSLATTDLKIKQMILEWNYKESNQYQYWELSASQDLHHWQKLTDASLVWLEKEGQSLIQNQIPLNLDSNDYQYLQLRCIEFCQGIRISTIKFVEESTEHFYPADTQWTIKGKKSSSQKPIKLQHKDNWESKTAWDFHRKDNAVIDKVTLNLGEQVYGDKIRILGKAKLNAPWKLVYEGIWFNTKVGSRWFSSNNLFSLGQDLTELRLEFAAELKPELTPELIFHTPSKYIQFIGNQTPPYRLFVAADTNTDAQTRILNSLINNQSVTWVNHQWTFLNPEYQEATAAVSWKSILFWGLLLIAIGLLGWMTIKLFRQMNTHQD